jgi:hypothetical protein
MGPPSYMRSVVDRNVVKQRMTVVLRPVKSWPVYNFNVRRKYTLCFSVNTVPQGVMTPAGRLLHTTDIVSPTLRATRAEFSYVSVKNDTRDK